MEEVGSRGSESQNGFSWKVASPTYHHGSTSTDGNGLSSENNGGTESLLEKTGKERAKVILFLFYFIFFLTHD